MNETQQVAKLLENTFEPGQVSSILDHFREMVEEFQKRDWEKSILRAGKLIEAVAKALSLRVGRALPPDREFSVGTVMNHLENLPSGSFDDTVRLTMPRACRFVYDIASNRGARHDPGEIDPNEMDATVAVGVCSWLLSEMLRYSQKGLDLSRVHGTIAKLIRRRYPFIERIGERLYVELGLGARETELLLLSSLYPERISRENLIEATTRHGHSAKNAKVAMSRIRNLLDEDSDGGLLLRSSGIREAEEIISREARNNG